MTVTLAEALEARRKELQRRGEEARRREEREKHLVETAFRKLLDVELPDEVKVEVRKAFSSRGYEVCLILRPDGSKVYLLGRFIIVLGRAFFRPLEGPPWRGWRAPTFWKDFDNFLDAALFTEDYQWL